MLRVVFNIIPVTLVVGIIYLAIFGETGLIRRMELRADLERTERKLDLTRQENLRLQREVLQLRDSETTLRRAAAEELLLVPPGSTVYRFSADGR